METKSKKLFWMFVLYMVFQFGGIIANYTVEGLDLAWIGKSVVVAAFCFFLYKSYSTHTKNVMKPLLGAILAVILEYELMWALTDIQYIKEYLEFNAKFILLIIADVIIFILVTIININHYKMNATHHSTPETMVVNRFYYILYVATVVVRAIIYTFFTNNLAYNIYNIMAGVSDVFVMNMVISIETNLDEFRVERETKAE